MFPTRFYTGVRQVTVPNPAHLHRNDPTARTFEGLCSEYNFEKQTENFQRLQEVLIENGTRFLYVASAHYKGDLHTNHRFDAVAENGSLLWHKYVGHVAQGGQNHVFVGGMRIKVSIFLERTKAEQRALLSGERLLINLVFDESRMRFMNEDKTLWN